MRSIGPLISNLINDLLALLGIQLQPWMGPVFAIAVVILVLPAYFKNFRTRQARKRLVRASHAFGEERQKLLDEAMELVEGNPFGLIVVAEEAERRGMKELARKATIELGRTGKRTVDYRRLLRSLSGEAPISAEAEAAAVERLRAQGLEAMAEERLRKARERWPSSDALHGL